MFNHSYAMTQDLKICVCIYICRFFEVHKTTLFEYKLSYFQSKLIDIKNNFDRIAGFYCIEYFVSLN